jgi:hypothetical protein
VKRAGAAASTAASAAASAALFRRESKLC